MDDSADLKTFSGLVGAIYDAALDASQWPRALDSIREYLTCRTAAIGLYDIFDNNPPWDKTAGYDPDWMRVYMERYQVSNPFLAPVAEMGTGEADRVSARYELAEFSDTPFYKDWMSPQGFVDGAVLVLDKTMTSIGTLVVVRGEEHGIFDNTAMDRLALLFPHLRRAVLIGKTLQAHEARTADMATVLDTLKAGMLTLSATGDIVHANSAAAAMLASGAPIKALGGRLSLPTAPARRLLAATLETAARGDVEFGDRSASIPLAAGGGDYILHVLPLNVARRRAIDAEGGAAAVVFVRQVNPAHAEAVQALAERYGLTPQERRVAQALVDVGGAPMVADVLEISLTTVRTHITNIFDKTGVRRQADLIKLLLQMHSPFVA